MSIYKTAIEKPVTTALIFIALIILGIFSLVKLPIDQYPEIEAPYVSVMTSYSGNSSEIETNITKYIENTLNSIEGLDEMTSTSKDNISLVSLKFQWGYNIDEAVNDIRSALDMVTTSLPDGCSRPMVFKFNTSMMPILMYAITAEESYQGLEKILTDNVTNVLNRVDGIGNLSISGAPERYVYVDVDQEKIDAFGISLETVANAVSSNNMDLASGSIKVGKEQYQLRVKSEYVESSEINNIVVTTTPQGKKVFVKDIAVVKDTIKDLTLDEKIKGKDGCRLIIMKQTGANTAQVCADVQKMLVEEIIPTLPPDIKFQLINDSSDVIRSSVNGLAESIFYALLFVVLVVLFFLGQWRASIIIGVCIPISLVVSFIYLLATGSSLNVISLSSLTVAIGMVVDDAIVVLENIDKHLQRGSSPREAAIYATNEVWVSVIATTLVIVAVFVPLTMLTGMAGILFKELGWIVTICVCTSTTVAISLTPMMASKMMKTRDVIMEKLGKGKTKQEGAISKLYKRTVIKGLDWLDDKYAMVLRWCLKHKAITILSIVIFFGISLIPLAMDKIGMDFMPVSDQGRLTVNFELQRGTRIEESAKIAREIEKEMVKNNPEIIMFSTTMGSNDDAGLTSLMSSTSNYKGQMNIRTTKKYERETTIQDIAKRIRTQLENTPEVTTFQVSTSSGGGGMGSNSVDVEIYGYDFDVTSNLAQQYADMLRTVEGAKDIKISREADRAELQIVFDKEKLSSHGLTSSAVAAYVRYRIYGYTAGYLKEDGDEYDIRVRLKEDNRNSLTKLEELTIPTATGNVKIKELAEIKEYWCPPTIERKSRQRIVTISVTPVDVSLSELAENIQTRIDGVKLPEGVKVVLAGDYKEQQESFSDMAMLFALIVLLVYVVMASQFESLSKPFIIMMSIPFAFSGVIFALLITGATLNIIGALGVILLVGIVVKNGIVLIDYINLMRDRDYELNEAIALSGKSRLRPVLMTAATTILGMIPMALSTSEGSEMWVSMGIVVIGGLTVSTIITLLIVPVLYAIFSKHGERDNETQLRKNFIFFDMADDVVFDSRKPIEEHND
ncbi:MAG: efflux RND transporter permease subunit [Bacteroidales bacterium]|nr:efflux RND transporter permease subunit [Bacteroidales bacterium]